jgi:hypothetical protein
MYDINDMNQLKLNDVLLNGGQEQKKHYAILEIVTSHPRLSFTKGRFWFPIIIVVPKFDSLQIKYSADFEPLSSGVELSYSASPLTPL